MLWNPWVHGGSPDFIETQFGAFSPMLLLFASFMRDGIRMFSVYWTALLCLSAVGMMLLSRRLGFSPWIGFVATLGFMASGFFTGHAEHTSYLKSYSPVTLILWRLEAGLQSNRKLPYAEAGIIWGMSGLGGYPGILLLTLITGLIWVAGRYLCGVEVPGKQPPVRPKPAVILAGVIIMLSVGIAVLSPSYLTFFREGTGYTTRSGGLLRNTAVFDDALSPYSLRSLSNPYLHVASMWSPSQMTYTDISGMGMYIGASIPFFFFPAFFRKKHRPWTIWLAGWSIFCLMCSLSHIFPFRGWLYDFLPPFRYFRHSNIFRAVFMLLTAVVAMYGFRNYAELLKKRTLKPLLFFLLYVLLASSAVYVFMDTIRSFAHLDWLWQAKRHVAAAWGGLGIVLAAPFILPLRIRRPVFIAILITVAVIDHLGAMEISRFVMHDRGAKRGFWKSIEKSWIHELDLKKNNLPRILRLYLDEVQYENNLNIIMKIPSQSNYLPLMNAHHRDMFSDKLIHNKIRFPFLTAEDVVFLYDAEFHPVSKRCVGEFITQYAEDPSRMIIVLHEKEHMANFLETYEQPLPNREIRFEENRILTPETGLIYRLHEYTPMMFDFSVNAPEAGWVFSPMRWSPGWEVVINGRPEKILGANFVFRAVPVKKGENRVTYRYRPLGIPLLILLSWQTILAVLLWRPARCVLRKLIP